VGKMHSHPWDNSTGFANRDIAEDKFMFEVMDDYAVWHMYYKSLFYS